MNSETIPLLYGPVLIGLAVAVLLSHLLTVVYRLRPTTAQEWEFEKRRQMRMAEWSSLYRLFEPFISELVKLADSRWFASLTDGFKVNDSVQKSLDRLGTSVPFHRNEYLALTLFQGVLVGILTVACLRTTLSQPLLGITAISLVFMTCYAQLSELKGKAKRRLAEFKRRLPFSIDLLALTVDAGATFMESLETMVAENADNPVGEEFGELQRKVMSGQTMNDALEEMRLRMADPTVDEIVFSIVNSEKLGTPKSKTLLRLANQMRQKRSQSIEKAIGQAQTMMTFPGFIIMLACLLIVAAPFGLAALQQNVF
ncbi:MAG: type II secretion system F family protein [Planctomycetota bacterium]